MIQLKNDCDAKIIKIENKIVTEHDHDKRNSTQETNIR